jgi:hypothetical protein
MAVLATVGAGLRYWMSWTERQADKRREHETKMAQDREEWETTLTARLEAMQTTFLGALQERDAKLERHRTEHLDDTRRYAATLAEVTRALRDRASHRPPAE